MPNDIRKMESEIKDIVIAKLLDKVIKQHKELSKLELENSQLKITVTELYKKIIIIKASSSSSNFPLAKKQRESNKNYHSQETLPAYNTSTILQSSNSNNSNGRLTALDPFSPLSGKSGTHQSKLNNNTNKISFRNKLKSKDRKIGGSLLNNSGSVLETQSCVIPSVDRTNTSRLLTNTSSKLQSLVLSPRIGDYSQYNTGEESTNVFSRHFTSTRNNYELKAKRLRIMNKLDNFLDKNSKRVIKVTLKNNINNAKLNNMTIC